MKDLLDHLEDLRKLLNSTCLERTAGLKAAMGTDCSYYRKSKDIFLSREYDKVKSMYLLVLEEYRKIEGDKLGR